MKKLFSTWITACLLFVCICTTSFAVTNEESETRETATLLEGTIELDYEYDDGGNGKIELEFSDGKVIMKKRTYSGCNNMKTPQKDKYQGLEYVVNGDMLEISGFHYVNCRGNIKYTGNLNINLGTGEMDGKLKSKQASHNVLGKVTNNTIRK